MEIVGVAPAASVTEFDAFLLVPIIVEPGNEGPTNSNFHGQEADI